MSSRVHPLVGIVAASVCACCAVGVHPSHTLSLPRGGIVQLYDHPRGSDGGYSELLVALPNRPVYKKTVEGLANVDSWIGVESSLTDDYLVVVICAYGVPRIVVVSDKDAALVDPTQEGTALGRFFDADAALRLKCGDPIFGPPRLTATCIADATRDKRNRFHNAPTLTAEPHGRL